MDENHGNIDEHNGQEICWLQNAANKQANRKEKWPYLLVKEGAVRSYGDGNIPYSMLNTGATNGVSPHDRYRGYRGIVGNPLPPIIWKTLYTLCTQSTVDLFIFWTLIGVLSMIGGWELLGSENALDVSKCSSSNPKMNQYTISSIYDNVYIYIYINVYIYILMYIYVYINVYIYIIHLACL